MTSVKGMVVPCVECGKSMVKKRFDQRFCSRKCGQTWGNKHAKWELRRNREQLNAERKRKYHESKGETSAQRRLERSRNPEKARARDKERYYRDRDKILKRQKLARQSNPEKYRATSREAYARTRRRSPWMSSLQSAQKRAKQKSMPFDLTHEWAISRWTGRCEISDIEFRFDSLPFSATIDRINPLKGYVKTNCRFILFALNSMRGAGTDKELFDAASVILPALISKYPYLS